MQGKTAAKLGRLGLGLSFLWQLSVSLGECQPARIVLKNGRSLRGEVERTETGKLLIVFPRGTIQLSPEEIRQIIHLASIPSRFGGHQTFWNALRETPNRSVTVPSRGSVRTTPYDPFIHHAAARNRLDPALIKAVVAVESGFNPKDVSHKGAMGLMQLMPETAQCLGVGHPFDPAENVEGGTRFLKDLLEIFNGNLEHALAAYNAGPTTVHRYGGIPPYPETQRYVREVLVGYSRYSTVRQPTQLFTYAALDGHLIISDLPHLP